MKNRLSGIIKKYLSFFKIIFTLSLALLLNYRLVKAQNKPNVIDELDVIHSQGAGGKDNTWIQFSDAQNSLYHYLSGQAYPLLEKRADAVSGLHTLADWQKRQEWLRTNIKDVVGAFPPKTPLNARITRTINKDEDRKSVV